jgi:hypothetical protein
MLIEVPRNPWEYHDNLLKLSKYLNRCVEIEGIIRAELMEKPCPEKKTMLKYTLDQAKATYGNLRLTKQMFNMMINKAEMFDKDGNPPDRSPEESDIPGQDVEEEFNFDE